MASVSTQARVNSVNRNIPQALATVEIISNYIGGSQLYKFLSTSAAACEFVVHLRCKMYIRTLPEYKEQLNPKRLRAEAPWERFTSGSQVTAYQHTPLWQIAQRGH